jgi:hypothetical protein
MLNLYFCFAHFIYVSSAVLLTKRGRHATNFILLLNVLRFSLQLCNNFLQKTGLLTILMEGQEKVEGEQCSLGHTTGRRYMMGVTVFSLTKIIFCWGN